MSRVTEIQTILGVKPDGIWGPKSQGALEAAINETKAWHKVTASSFADPADVEAFKKCKATGKSDRECFKVGDNAIGKWGDSTAQGSGPSVALPPEIWEPFKNPRKKKLLVRYSSKEVECELKDTMPAIENIKNGARIDLNPDACKALGLTPPMMTTVEWKWI